MAMTIRRVAGMIWTAGTATVVLEQESDTRDEPGTAPDTASRRPRMAAPGEAGGRATPLAQSTRPWPFHVLRDAAPDADTVMADRGESCRR
jgi:hypothetical protein